MDKVFSHYEVFKPEAQKTEYYGEIGLKDSGSDVLIQTKK